jgi:hypothetical protein
MKANDFQPDDRCIVHALMTAERRVDGQECPPLQVMSVSWKANLSFR